MAADLNIYKLLTTPEAAKMLGLTRHGVVYLIKIGQLKAAKVGHGYAILDSDVRELKRKRAKSAA